MVTLFCAFVGTKGSVFPVHIDASQSVGHLKDAIKMDNQRRITCDANDLQLYPAKTKSDTAKTEDGKWLSSSTEDVKKLKEGEKTSHVVELTKEDREMQGEDSITQLLAGMETPKARQIYVLVVIPDHEQQLHAQNVHDSIRMREARIIDSRFRRLLNEKLAPLLHKKSKSVSNATLGQSEIARLEKGKQIMHFAPVEYGEVFWSEEVQTQADAITNKAVLTHLLLLFSAAY